MFRSLRPLTYAGRCASQIAQNGGLTSQSSRADSVVVERLSSLWGAACRSNGDLPTSVSSALMQVRGLMVSTACKFDVFVPPMGESVSEGTVAAVLKKQGDAVKEDDVIAQLETDKVTVDIKYPAKEPGVLTQLFIKEQDTVKVGQKVAFVAQGEVPAAAPAAAAPAPSATASSTPAAATKPAAIKSEAPKHEDKAPPKATGPAPEPDAPLPRQERRVKMTRLRMRVAERLKSAQNTYAMLSTFNEVDMTNIMELRNTYKDLFAEKHGVKLGFMSVFVKAAADALRSIPAVNGVIDGDEIIYRDYCDISIAVATPKGLVVPVLRNADTYNMAQIERKIGELGKKARDGTISIDDMAGGTFTISNGGVYGSLLSTPIINPPQSAILGMHAINKRPTVVSGDKIEARPIMNIALTYDHRLIDGREAVTFLKRIKEVVEDPRRLLLEV